MNTTQTAGIAPADAAARVSDVQITAALDILEDTKGRAAREGLQLLPLHTVLADGMCSCGHPLCFHPGKHSGAEYFPEGENYTTSMTCGRAPVPIPCNLGVIATGCIILNMDAGYGGFTSFATVFPQHGTSPIPGTWTVGTPGGGLHLWFRLPAGITLRSSFMFLGPGLSALSGPSAYGIVPPSTGLNQAPYTWESPPDVGIAPIPDGMLPTIVEADATEERGWHVRMTRDQIAARVHADFCARYFKVDYDAFATTWSAVAEYLEERRIRPESFISSIHFSWMREGLQPEDLLDPEVLATRAASVRCYWPKTVKYFYKFAGDRLDRYMRNLGPLETRYLFAQSIVSSRANIPYLIRAVIALYGFPPGVHADVWKRYAKWALDELDQCDLLGQALKRQYFVHPEELRCRLARFIEMQAS